MSLNVLRINFILFIFLSIHIGTWCYPSAQNDQNALTNDDGMEKKPALVGFRGSAPRDDEDMPHPPSKQGNNLVKMLPFKRQSNTGALKNVQNSISASSSKSTLGKVFVPEDSPASDNQHVKQAETAVSNMHSSSYRNKVKLAQGRASPSRMNSQNASPSGLSQDDHDHTMRHVKDAEKINENTRKSEDDKATDAEHDQPSRLIKQLKKLKNNHIEINQQEESEPDDEKELKRRFDHEKAKAKQKKQKTRKNQSIHIKVEDASKEITDQHPIWKDSKKGSVAGASTTDVKKVAGIGGPFKSTSNNRNDTRDSEIGKPRTNTTNTTSQPLADKKQRPVVIGVGKETTKQNVTDDKKDADLRNKDGEERKRVVSTNEGDRRISRNQQSDDEAGTDDQSKKKSEKPEDEKKTGAYKVTLSKGKDDGKQEILGGSQSKLTVGASGTVQNLALNSSKNATKSRNATLPRLPGSSKKDQDNQTSDKTVKKTQLNQNNNTEGSKGNEEGKNKGKLSNKTRVDANQQGEKSSATLEGKKTKDKSNTLLEGKEASEKDTAANEKVQKNMVKNKDKDGDDKENNENEEDKEGKNGSSKNKEDEKKGKSKTTKANDKGDPKTQGRKSPKAMDGKEKNVGSDLPTDKLPPKANVGDEDDEETPPKPSNPLEQSRKNPKEETKEKSPEVKSPEIQKSDSERRKEMSIGSWKDTKSKDASLDRKWPLRRGAADTDGSSGSSHFIVYGTVGLILLIVLYVIYQKRQKILALIVEGRQRSTSGSGERSRRGSGNVAYRPLPTKDTDDTGPRPESLQKYIY